MTNKEIKKLCRSFGADLVGVASVERFVNAPKGYHPTDVMPTAKSVISLRMVLPKDILEQDIRTYTDARSIGDIPGLQQLQPMCRFLPFGSTH